MKAAVTRDSVCVIWREVIWRLLFFMYFSHPSMSSIRIPLWGSSCSRIPQPSSLSTSQWEWGLGQGRNNRLHIHLLGAGLCLWALTAHHRMTAWQLHLLLGQDVETLLPQRHLSLHSSWHGKWWEVMFANTCFWCVKHSQSRSSMFWWDEWSVLKCPWLAASFLLMSLVFTSRLLLQHRHVIECL